VLVCGARVAGASCARVLLALGAGVTVTDAAAPPDAADLPRAGARMIGAVDAPPAGTELVVTSPGWRLDSPLFAAARARGIEVIGEVELAWRLGRLGDTARRPATWLALTGTNGKTTTVRMLESILRATGQRALAVGNVGVPIVEAVASGAYDVLAVELSSYQLAWSTSLRPLAAAVLNLAPDHLDWHGSMAAYVAAKAGIWTGDVAIGNADDERVAAAIARAPGRPVTFTLDRPRAGQLGVEDGWLVDRAFGSGERLLPASEVRPHGPHNVANALAATALARAYGVDGAAVSAGLRAFVPDPHRNQFINTVAGVDYVDDSKATNPHAAEAALRAYPRIIWIAGGQLKGVDVDELVARLAARPGVLAGAVLMGADRAEIAAALARHAPDVPVIDVSSTDDGAMSAVVRVAAALARPGDTVLLSPAAASYDMFTGYAQRGERFAAAVRALANAGERGGAEG
jgi:UDP-N-acetylmuramoylalanine--D-glutamate ligase